MPMPLPFNAHALVIGIASYQHIHGLPATVLQDAQDMYDLLLDPQYCAYPAGNVQLLVDECATQLGIREALAGLAERSGPDAVVWIYLSCHGGRIDAGPFLGEYLLPVDADYTTTEALSSTAISGAEFTAALRKIPARKLVVVFDCCHAGGIGQAKDAFTPDWEALPERYYETLLSGHGRVIFASSRSTEASWILPGAANSLFTQHMLAGLRGGAPGPGGVIRVFDLFHYLQPLVTRDQPNQHPIFKAELEDNFPVALYLGGKPEALPIAVESSAAAKPADGYEYDVFLSYRQKEPDKTWVRQILLPRLEAAGVKTCIDYRDFRLGAPLLFEMARGIEQSRYTLAVLSPAYLESNFTELENVLAEHLGVENDQRRLLCVMREPCVPRLGIRARLWLDMTDDRAFDTNLARLVFELRWPNEKE